MFNYSLDAYGAIKRPVAVQNSTSSLNAVSAGVSSAGTKAAEKIGNRVPVEVDKAALDAAVKKLNELVAPALQTIQFTVDEDTDRVVVKVVDTETQKVLRQIPNEEVLAFSKTLGKLQGLVIRQTA